MVQQVVFINLFIVPLISILICSVKTKEEIVLSVRKAIEYGVMVALNIPLTKVFVFAARYFAEVDISIDSGFYTIAAIVSAVIIADVWVWVRKNANKVSDDCSNDSSNDSKKNEGEQ